MLLRNGAGSCILLRMLLPAEGCACCCGALVLLAAVLVVSAVLSCCCCRCCWCGCHPMRCVHCPWAPELYQAPHTRAQWDLNHLQACGCSPCSKHHITTHTHSRHMLQETRACGTQRQTAGSAGDCLAPCLRPACRPSTACLHGRPAPPQHAGVCCPALSAAGWHAALHPHRERHCPQQHEGGGLEQEKQQQQQQEKQ